MRKLIAASLVLLFLGACSSERTETQHEHDGIACVYDVKYDFIGREMSRKLITCGPEN